MDKESIQHKIEELEKQNIEFVHKYSFGVFSELQKILNYIITTTIIGL